MKIRQAPLSFKIQADENNSGVTSFAGLPSLIEACRCLGVSSDLASGLGIRKSDRGYSEVDVSEAILALIAAGGNHLSDIASLNADPCLSRLLGKKRFPDERTLGNFLRGFHEEDKVEPVAQGYSYIPEESLPLQLLGTVINNLTKRTQRLSPSKIATLDWDTQVIFSAKEEALRTYKGGRGYQPGAILWKEQGLVINDEFRPGNVPSGFRVKELVKRTVEKRLPSGMDRIDFRGDSAAYDWDLMKYLDSKGIHFAITADFSEELAKRVEALPREAFKKLYSCTEYGKIWNGDRWAEVEFVSKESVKRFRKPLRYIAIQHAVQQRLPGLRENPDQPLLPGLAEDDPSQKKYHVVVTNWSEEKLAGDQVVRWHRERCGSIERVFRVFNNDQAASCFPCGQYGANAAWYRYNVLLFNLVQAMRLLALPDELKKRELKGIRFSLLRLAGRVVQTAGSLILRISSNNPALGWLRSIREALRAVVARLRAIPNLAPG